MPKNKLQDVVFTLIMATIMVYGMIVYNVALNTGSVTGKTFVMALHEMPIMVPIAFVLEFFDGYFVPDVLLWPAGAVYIPPYLPGKVNP